MFGDKLTYAYHVIFITDTSTFNLFKAYIHIVKIIRATILIVFCLSQPHVADRRAPVFKTCPEDAMTFISDPMQETATVNWQAPSALDHSNNKIVGVYVSGPTPGSSLEGGSYPVVYVAEDASGNTANCKFTVVVSGNALTLLPTDNIGSFMLFHFHKHMDRT